MSLEVAPSSPASSQEPIPGYRLLERIGRGGYGEVWKTTAPGGVPKAIKLIYGDDSSRMATELKSLNRVKEVRHPFLLSIERIEQCGDFLAIVTELGDKNLQQYFNECRAKELPGIPQNELLKMMRDVADVLDYIYQEYALQHLDIKPANMLVFGARLKVADFGLVKNIYERQASMVHGLTPTYAAPEIFDGQPTRSSDQYSLAIMYQEMLTGVLPFDGQTAARLATQHMREAPNLRPLPPQQQPVIARALSKNPHQRFSSCVELVDELIEAMRRTDPPPARKEQPSAHEQTAKPQQPVAAPTIARPTVSKSHPVAETVPNFVSAQGTETTPTIVIGIGGSAGKALQRLRLRIGDRLGGIDALPAFKMLFLDVDQESLNEINLDHQAWTELDAIPTPLRSSAEYREQGHHRRWLARRWLFNVPRDLRTDGLRPLGRLALVSNASRIMTSIRSAVQQVASTCPGKSPRVLLLTSISGGTGSGMVLDLAYATRHELRSAGFPEAAVDAVLMYSTPVGAGRDKAVLNAVATLTELHHYSTQGNFYPGEPLLQIPSFHGNNQTFTSTQFVHLGEDLDTSQWQSAIDNVAEHVYCRLFTNMDRALGGNRAVPGLPSVDPVQLHQIGPYAGSLADELSRQLCEDVINGWCGAELQPGVSDHRTCPSSTLILDSLEDGHIAMMQRLGSEAESNLLACGIEVNQLLRSATELLQKELAVPQRDFLQAQYAEVLKAVTDDTPNHEIASLTIALQDRAIGLDFGERPADHSRNQLFDVLHAKLAKQALPIVGKFIGWVCNVIDQPKGSVDAARHAAEAGRFRIRELINSLQQDIQEQQSEQTKSRILLMSPPGQDDSGKGGWLSRRSAARNALAERLIEHGLCSFQELLDVLVHWQLRSIESHLSTVIDHLVNMWHELKQLGKQIGKENVVTSSRKQLSKFEWSLWKWVVEQRPKLAQELRMRIENDVLAGPRKLQRLLQQRCSLEQVLGGALVRHSRQVVLQTLDLALSSSLRLHSKKMPNQGLEIDEALVELLRTPWAMDAGSAELTLLVAPAGTTESEFRSRAVPNLPRLPVMPARTNSLAIYRESRDVPIQNVLQSVTHGQDGWFTLAVNLHARIDVDWNATVDPAKPQTGNESGPATWTEVPQTMPIG